MDTDKLAAMPNTKQCSPYKMINALRRILPSRIRSKIRELLITASEDPPTVAQGWDKYAQNYESEEGKYLGDEWSEPEVIGIDVPADRIVSYLDEKVFAPFLGNCEVLLEIGPGGGRFTEILLPKCNKFIAADTSPTMLRLLRERFMRCTKIEYLLLDGRGLSPIPDKSVDAAFSYGVFVHLQHWDIYNYLSELNRVLKQGGRAIIQHANTFSGLGWKKFLTEVYPSLNKHKLPGTFTLMIPEIMKEFAKRAGLKLDDCLTNVVRRDCISLIRLPDK